ncbi:MAG: sulfotransferase [Acidimicrobiales bacterium]
MTSEAVPPRAAEPPWEVLYIAGWGRSGSTLLTALLGEHPRVFGAGEIRSLWKRGALDRRRCGCGRPVPDCPVWRPVLEQVATGPMTASSLAALQHDRLRSRHYPVAVARALAGRPTDGDVDRYAETYRRAYEAGAEVTGARVIVDSSKYPLDAYFLARAGIPMRVIHLVRNPRAVAGSWARPKALLDAEEGADDHLRRFSPMASSSIWTLWNTTVQLLLTPQVGSENAMTVRFEDFLGNPAQTIRSIDSFAGLEPSEPAVNGRKAALGENHLVAGNSDRFRQGSVTIDGRRHASTLSAGAALAATIPALPLLRRFGYPLRPMTDGSGRRSSEPKR